VCVWLKEVAVSQPSSCISFIDRGVVFATDKFYVIGFDGFALTGMYACLSSVKSVLLFLQLSIILVWLSGVVVSALGIRGRGPGFNSRVVPLFIG